MMLFQEAFGDYEICVDRDMPAGVELIEKI